VPGAKWRTDTGDPFGRSAGQQRQVKRPAARAALVRSEEKPSLTDQVPGGRLKNRAKQKIARNKKSRETKNRAKQKFMNMNTIARIRFPMLLTIVHAALAISTSAADSPTFSEPAKELARLLNGCNQGEWRQNASVSGRILLVDCTPDATFPSYAFRRLFLDPEVLDPARVEAGEGFVKDATRSGKTIRVEEYGRDAGKLMEQHFDSFEIWVNAGQEKQVAALLLQLIASTRPPGLEVGTYGSTSPSLDKQTKRELPGWGTAVDPDHDCTFFLAEDALSISVPGSHPHDLAAEIHSTNAPRVLQSVRGDFTIQVRVEGRFAPGDESTQPGRTGYNGAAVVAMSDAENTVTLARAVLQRGEEAEPYANFEIRVDGELQRIGLTGDHPLPKAGPVFLRLERRGSKFLGAVSADGMSWDVLGAKQIPEEWPKELQTGIAAISTSKEEFNPRFSKLQILK
jgi:hypothetical protein